MTPETRRAAWACFLAAACVFLRVPRPGLAAEASLDAEELKIYSPGISSGERELESEGFDTQGHQQGYAFSAGYSPTPYWASEAYEIFHRDPGGALAADAVELENRFQLAPLGKYWLDMGLLTEVALPQQSNDAGEVRIGAILEKQLGKTLLTLNLPFEWQYGPGFTPGTGLSYAARAEYLINPYFSPAVESFGEPGIIGRFSPAQSQTHSIGPAIYGSLTPGARKTIQYSVSDLFGLTASSPPWTLVARLEFEF
ncbi:MAG: hypothetical protein ACYCPQ_00085 [Elusimicrobiota bacterium]